MHTNSLVKDFTARLRSKFADDSENMSMSTWIERNTTLKKKPFSFEGYEFQRQIADDMHPDLVCIKCSQVGLTEIQLRKFLAFLKRNTAVTGIFTLPDDTMFKRLSSTRVKPLISSERVFNMDESQTPVRSLGLYQIDQSFGYFTGNKESDATSIPADLKMHDELDLSDQDIISLFSSRLQNSDYKISQCFSTPTFVGYGVDGLSQVSDQHEYLLRCEGCNHHNLPTVSLDFVTIPGLTADINKFDELTHDILNGIDLSAAYIRCENCGNKLHRNDPSLRQWVPRKPGAQVRGYRVLPFSTSRISIPHIVKQLLDYKKQNTLRRWYNTVCAEAYNDENARLTEGAIKAVMFEGAIPSIDNSVPVFIGIDVGHTCHITLIAMNHAKPNAFLWKQVKADDLVQEVEHLRSRYNIVSGCMDRHPETTLANAVRDESNGVIMPVEYRGTSALEFVEDEVEVVTHVQGNRTQMIDVAANAVRKSQISFTGYTHYGPFIVQHLQDMVRIDEPDKPAVWNKLTGQDHFFHSLAFALFAIRMRNAIDFSVEDDVRTMVIASNVNMKTPPVANLGVVPRQKQGATLWHP